MRSIVHAWNGTSRERRRWKWGQLATVAAHYGHMAGLEFIVEDMDGHWDAWLAFQNLTGYRSDPDGVPSPTAEKEARKWFEDHKSRLEFDRAKGRYIVRKL